MRLAFYGRVSTEDAQDPEASHGWQMRRAMDLIVPLGHTIGPEYFDVGQSRSLPWKRRPQASALLEAIRRPDREFDGIVIGEPQRAFYGSQFALTFPVLVHYGVTLFVPEVAGPVDPDSEAHEIVMNLFGGMAKGERQRIRARTKSSMQALASNTNRHLGGRPPYGYKLIDVGPHPHPGKAAAGLRAHQLALDEVTAPYVQRIFDLYASGEGLRSIAQTLTDEGIPSPSAHDPVRNSHRDPRGWSHGTVRAILANPAYSGVRVWGKQEKFEELLDVEDVAAGTIVRMRWRDKDQWITPLRPQTHQAIVDQATFDAVQARMNTGRTRGTSKPRESAHSYPLRGLMFCSCGTRMQGAWRSSKKGPGRTLYRCELSKLRSVPPELAGHPRTAYVNQAHVLPRLDSWIEEELGDPQWLASCQEPDEESPELAHLRRRLREVDDALANLMGVLERGIVSDTIVSQVQHREQERADLAAQVERLDRPRVALTARDIAELIQEVGGVAKALGAATDAERGELYGLLGIRLDFDPLANRLSVQADLSRVAGRVRRGT